MPKLSVVVTASASIAFDSLDGENLLSTALRTARSFSIETSLPNRLYVAAKDLTLVAEATKNLDFEFGVIDCDPSKPAELAKAVEPLDFEIIALHDAQRPLTRSEQFHRTLEGLFGCDAVRPSMAFTETLKEINNQSILTHTIDRTKVRRISTPEIIRRSVIDFAGADSFWMLPLMAEARLSQVEADPESLRINSAEEITLMEAFLHWQQKIAK